MRLSVHMKALIARVANTDIAMRATNVAALKVGSTSLARFFDWSELKRLN
jgi:hypothetical protein